MTIKEVEQQMYYLRGEWRREVDARDRHAAEATRITNKLHELNHILEALEGHRYEDNE
ncbi:hypothetical protein LCGC14_1140910 [marine sediment metagenome]|uniref:Uncharacterized protein n=1 Tax=marine sediment metagenome TaxID=412755 RepID=A0A0F9MLD4_9ZZZZ